MTSAAKYSAGQQMPCLAAQLTSISFCSSTLVAAARSSCCVSCATCASRARCDAQLPWLLCRALRASKHASIVYKTVASVLTYSDTVSEGDKETIQAQEVC